MSRKQSLNTINHLYGLETDYVQAAIDQLGPKALSDEAVEWIAARQLSERQQQAEFIQRIDEYQKNYPHLGWSECELQVRQGIR